MIATESGVIIVDVYDVKVMSSLDDMSDETICSLMEYVEVAVIEESIPVIISMLLDKRTIFNEKHSY